MCGTALPGDLSVFPDHGPDEEVAGLDDCGGSCGSHHAGHIRHRHRLRGPVRDEGGEGAGRTSNVPHLGWSCDGEGAPRWRELAIGSADSSLGIGNPYLEQYLVVITEAKADFPEGYTLAEFAPLAAEQAASNVIDLQATEFEEVTVGGLKGLRREVTGKADGLGIFYLNTYLESPGYFHQVMAWTLRENEERYRPVLKEAADSFREVGAAAP